MEKSFKCYLLFNPKSNVNKGNVETIKRLEYIPLEFTYLRKMMNLGKSRKLHKRD